MANIFWFCLGHAALLTNVQVCAVCLMSTHYHLVIVDRDGRLPEFLHELNRNFALSIAAFRGGPGEVFDKRQATAVELVNAEAVIKQLGYTTGNPARSFAVRYARDWSGARTTAKDVESRRFEVKRPDYWFRKPLRESGELRIATRDNPPRERGPDGTREPWPDAVVFDIEMPAMLTDAMKPEEARRRHDKRERQVEREAWNEAQQRKISFLGSRRVLRTPHTQRARSYEVFGSRNPRFSAAGDAEAARAAVARIRAFNASYDEGLEHWRGGDRRRAVFPAGTWSMRVLHDARCRPPP